MIALQSLNAASAADFERALERIFEHSPWVPAEAAKLRPFESLGHLFDALRGAVLKAPEAQRLSLIRAHPDLGAKLGMGPPLTASSAREQQSAGLDRLSEAEFDAFHRLNTAYRTRFGMPFIICVRRHTRECILERFRRRMAADFATEMRTAIEEICHIAALRLDEQVTGPDRLPVHGHLSTHVLDTHAGRPAAGIDIELCEVSVVGAQPIAQAKTNADGRTDQPLVSGRPLPIGRYELRFGAGAYFAARGVPLADPPFLDVVPVRFAVADPAGRYHVPLLVTPWSYSTYRGS